MLAAMSKCMHVLIKEKVPRSNYHKEDIDAQHYQDRENLMGNLLCTETKTPKHGDDFDTIVMFTY